MTLLNTLSIGVKIILGILNTNDVGWDNKLNIKIKIIIKKNIFY